MAFFKLFLKSYSTIKAPRRFFTRSKAHFNSSAKTVGLRLQPFPPRDPDWNGWLGCELSAQLSEHELRPRWRPVCCNAPRACDVRQLPPSVNISDTYRHTHRHGQLTRRTQITTGGNKSETHRLHTCHKLMQLIQSRDMTTGEWEILNWAHFLFSLSKCPALFH